MKTLISLFLLFGTIAPESKTYQLQRRNVVNNEISLLIPKEFKHISKEDYIPSYQGDPKPDDYFSNQDKSIEISFIKIPKPSEELSWAKQFMATAFLGNDSKFYFNDIISVGKSSIHLAEFEATFKGERQFLKMFVINGKDSAILGTISCHLKHKEKWKLTADKILKSIERN